MSGYDLRFGERIFYSELVTPNNAMVIDVYNQVAHGSDEDVVLALWQYVCKNIDYPLTFDGRADDTHVLNAFVNVNRAFLGPTYLVNRSSGDMWQYPSETLAWGMGDCLPLDTKIICVAKGKYKVNYIGDLKKGDNVLSYNWEEGKYEPRRVTAILDKGVKPIVEVKLRNGCGFRSTIDHHFFRWNQGYRRQKSGNLFFRQRLGQVQYEKENLGKILVAKQIPALNQKKRLKEAELWLEGAYAAEGWSEKGHVSISGDSPSYKFEIVSRLIQLDMPFSMSRRSRHSYISILKSPLKDSLRRIGRNAFEKQFLEDRLSCSQRQLESLIDGYAKGDGYLNPVNTTPNSNRVRMYTTSSDKLAFQLCFIHLILGRPLNSWYQLNHQGAGTMPIWRLTENTASVFNREVLPGVSKVSIKEVKERGFEEVRDITVEHNHNFILADSFTIASNCEDSSSLLASLLRRRFEPDRVFVEVGYWGGGGHAWVNFDGHILETTLDSLPAKPWELDGGYDGRIRYNDTSDPGRAFGKSHLDIGRLRDIASVWGQRTKGERIWQ